MIIGIGLDMIEVDRIEEKVSRENGFKEMIFSPSEIAYCESNAHPAEHYAARFAAKEALLKALGKGFTISYSLNQIIIEHDDNGKPVVSLTGPFKALEEGWKKVHLSMSHLKSIASAIVIIEQ